MFHLHSRWHSNAHYSEITTSKIHKQDDLKHSEEKWQLHLSAVCTWPETLSARHWNNSKIASLKRGKKLYWLYTHTELGLQTNKRPQTLDKLSTPTHTRQTLNTHTQRHRKHTPLPLGKIKHCSGHKKRCTHTHTHTRSQGVIWAPH